MLKTQSENFTQINFRSVDNDYDPLSYETKNKSNDAFILCDRLGARRIFLQDAEMGKSKLAFAKEEFLIKEITI